MEPQIQFCTSADGTRIAYTVFGAGPPLVQVPRWAHCIEWMAREPEIGRFYEKLAERHTVVIVERRGTGASQREVEDFSLDRHIEDLAAVVDKIGLDHFALFGAGDSGAVCLSYAAQHPDRVTRLVIWGAYARAEYWHRRLEGGGMGNDSLRSFVEFYRLNWPGAALFNAAAVFAEGPPERQQRTAALWQRLVSADVAYQYLLFTWSFDIHEQLRQVAAPTLVLHRREKQMGQHAREASEEIAALVQDGRLVQVNGECQIAEVDHEQVLANMLSFLAEDAPAARAPTAVPADGTVRYCTTEDGVQIAYKMEGEGPPLMIVPAVWESFSVEEEFAPELAAFYRAFGEGRTIIRYDARGSGLSQREVEDHSYRALWLDLKAVVEAAGHGPVTVWAVMHGGLAAMPFAAKCPDLVTRLIVFSVYARADSEELRQAWQSLADYCRHHWEQASQSMVDFIGRRDQPELALRAGDGLRRSITSEAMVQRILQSKGCDIRDDLRAIRCPTLVLGNVNEASQKEVADEIPSARFVPVHIPGGFYFDVTPGSILDAVNSFLDEDPRTRRLPSPPAVAPTPPASPPAAPELVDLDRPRVRYARTKDGVNIAYCATGSGKPVVMMNTLPWNHFVYNWEYFKAVAAVAAQRDRMFVTFDPRGLGSSSAADDLSLDAYVSDLEAVVEALGVDEIDLTANRYSCPVAIAYAAKHSDRVSRLALTAPFVHGRKALDNEMGRAVRALRDQDWELYTAASMQLILGLDKERAEQAAGLLRAAATPEMAQRTHDAVDAFDVSDLISDVRCPTLVTHQLTYTLTPIDESRRVAAGIRGAQFVMTDDDTQALLETGRFLGILEASEVQSGQVPVAPPVVEPPPEPITDGPPRVRYAKTKDGVNIAYCAIGSGKPLIQMSALPFRHFVFNWDYYKAIASVVTQRGRMFVTFDARGLGSSSAAADLSLDAYVSDLEAVVDAIDASEIDLQAVTYACPIAIAYAAKHPECVGKMALEMPFVRGKEALDTEVGRAVRALRGQNWELYSETSMYAIFSWNKEVAHRQAALLRAAATPEMAQRTYDAVDAFDVSKLMGAVRCPALVTFRTNVSLLPIDEARAVAAGIPNAQFAVAKDDEQWILETGTFLGILEPPEVQPGGRVAQPAVAAAPPAAPASGSEPAIRYARTKDGVNIAYWTLGAGPPLVWVPAWGFSNFEVLWEHPATRRFYEGLAAVRTLVAVVRRGAGTPEQAIGQVTLEDQVADLDAVIHHAGIEQCDLFGMDDGGSVAVAYAVEHPANVSRVVLWGPYAKAGGSGDRKVQAIVGMIRDNWPLARRSFADLNLPSDGGELRRWLADYFRRSFAPETAEAYMEFSADADVAGLLPRLSAPVLALQRRGDRLTPFKVGQSAAAVIGNAELVALEGDEHAPFFGDAGFMAQVHRFLGVTRTPSASAATHGTAIIMFADIVDSTGLTERIGDTSFRDKARVLDQTLRHVIESAGGTAIAGRTLGDGVLATFPAARQAIEAALLCATAGDEAGLPLHLGLHAGDIIREGPDIYGGAVNIAARISGLTGPSELLVSDIVRGLARTSADVEFEDRGEHTLKGVSDAVRVYAVRPKSAGRSALPDGLTAREVEVLRLIAAGRTNTEIADELTLSVRTVARHITNIYTKIRARNKVEATDYVHRNKLT